MLSLQFLKRSGQFFQISRQHITNLSVRILLRIRFIESTETGADGHADFYRSHMFQKNSLRSSGNSSTLCGYETFSYKVHTLEFRLFREKEMFRFIFFNDFKSASARADSRKSKTIFLVNFFPDKSSVTVNQKRKRLAAFDLIYQPLGRCTDKAGACKFRPISHIARRRHRPLQIQMSFIICNGYI